MEDEWVLILPSREITTYELCSELLQVLEGHSSQTKLFVAKCASRGSVDDSFVASSSSPATQYVTATDFAAPGLSSASTGTFCLPFLQAATRIRTLEYITSLCASCTEPYGPTYRAYFLSVATYIGKWRMHIQSLQKELETAGGRWSLADLHTSLFNRFSALEYLYIVTTASTLPMAEAPWVHGDETTEILSLMHPQRAAYMLDKLFKFLATCPPSDEAKTQTILTLFVHTIRPYARMIENWLQFSQLSTTEAFLDCDNTIAVTSELFWDVKYTLAKSTVDMALVPFFIGPVVQRMATAGKSIDIIRQLIENSVLRRKYSTSKDAAVILSDLQKFHLEQTIVDYLTHIYGVTDECKPVEAAKVVEQVVASQKFGGAAPVPKFIALSNAENLEASIDNPAAVLTPNFFQLSTLDLPGSQQMPAAPIETFIRETPLDLDNKWRTARTPDVPLGVELSKVFAAAIGAQCAVAAESTKRLLAGPCQLKQHLLAVRRFFMMELDSAFASFTQWLFSELHDGRAVGVGNLNLRMVEALTEEPGDDAFGSNMLSVYLIAPSGADVVVDEVKSLLEVDRIRLEYKVEWPLSLFIDERVKGQYNTLFSFLLQVRRSQHILTRLLSSDRTPRDLRRTNFQHRIHLLRTKLLQFTMTLKSFIAATVVQGSWRDLSDKLDAAVDLEKLIGVHQEYIQAILDRCFLSDKMARIKLALSKVLDMAVVLRAIHLDEGSETTGANGAALTKIEADFMKSSQVLHTILTQFTKLAKLPHVEELLIRLNFTGFYSQPAR